MRAFGSPTVINPFERFGDHLLLALGAPSSYQLMTWLESGPGADLPPRRDPPTGGRWVLCGYGRFGREVASDLRGHGLDVTIVEPGAVAEADVAMVRGDGSAPDVLAQANLRSASGFVAGTDNDTTNLSLVAAARRLNPDLFLAARQNRPANAPLFAALDVDQLLVPTELVAHEAYAQLSTPMLWRFLQEMPERGDSWAADLVQRLVEDVGPRLQSLWKVRLTDSEAPALCEELAGGRVALGDLVRDPEDRDEELPMVVLLALRGTSSVLTPGPDFVLESGDQLLLTGLPSARRALDATLSVDATAQYVLTGQHIASSWIWRRFTRRSPVLDSSPVRR